MIMKFGQMLLMLLLTSLYSNCYAAVADKHPNIMIFASFSMPTDSLKGWMRDAQKYHAAIMIRGLVDNSFKATVQKMTELTGDNQGGLQIDPTQFQRFHIDKVPAVVVVKDPNCNPDEHCKDEYDVIYGDVHLNYALRKIAQRKDSLAEIAENALLKPDEIRHG